MGRTCSKVSSYRYFMRKSNEDMSGRGWIILKLNFEKSNGVVQARLIWFWIETSGGLV
jgi:hypothetical protein